MKLFFSAILTIVISATAAFTTVNAYAADAQGEANKKIVLAFYEAALIKMDANAARPYLDDGYIQHNPTAPDGVEGVMGLIKFLKEKMPQRTSDIKRVIAEGDLVVLHVHSKPAPGERGTAIVDIFRVANGKIIEHWDVLQPVPETAKNNNTMF